METNNNKWKWISLAMIICTFLFCAMVVVVNNNPFQISFIADDNTVDISENIQELGENYANAEKALVACETKLDLYNKTHGDYWE